MTNYQATSPTPPPNFQNPPNAPKQKNVVGLIAFITSLVGFIFACIPGALIVGWILLPIAFILAIVSLFLKNKPKKLGIAGLIISVVGTIVAAIVFFAVVVTAVDDAFSSGDTTVSVPSEEAEDTAAVEEDTAQSSELGTRESPLPLGSKISDDDWEVTINSVDLDANDAIASENTFNDDAPEGETYILVNVTVQYIGNDPEGDTPFESIDYVTSSGNTVNSYDSLVVAPDSLDTLTTLYEGASETGNIAFSVPADTAGEGVLAVSPSIFGDTYFVAVR